MNIFKLSLLLLLTLLCGNGAFAEMNGEPTPNKSWVIPLSNKNVGSCQRQLFNFPDKDAYPIILLYTTQEGREFSDLFMPTYERIATLLHKTRTFYKYDAGTANPLVTSECLGLNGGIVMPTVNVVTRLIEAELLTNPMRAIGGTKWDASRYQAVSISDFELLNAITMPFPTGKNVKATHVIINHKK